MFLLNIYKESGRAKSCDRRYDTKKREGRCGLRVCITSSIVLNGRKKSPVFTSGLELRACQFKYPLSAFLLLLICMIFQFIALHCLPLRLNGLMCKIGPNRGINYTKICFQDTIMWVISILSYSFICKPGGTTGPLYRTSGRLQYIISEY